MMGRLFTRSTFCSAAFLLRRSFLKTNTPSKIFLATAPYSLFTNNFRDEMEDFDLKLKEACGKGETAIAELMDFLKDDVTKICNAYRNCLMKQIEIIDQATIAGISSPKWNELPELRTLASELSQQYQNVVSTVNILGQISQNETLQYITQQEMQFKLLDEKHKEIEKIIQSQVEETKELEQRLLVKTRDSIENSRSS